MLGAGVAACGSGFALAAGGPSLRTDHGCYRIKQPVHLFGSGFAPSRTYILTVDGVYFGQATTDASGSFSPTILAGGLPAGVPQVVDRLEASDGTNVVSTAFTLTRKPGARFLATSGSGTALKAPVEVWGYSINGTTRRVYMHYVAPNGSARMTLSLGHAGGQCGYLRTTPKRVFPFTPSRGTWTFQVDTRSGYAPRPSGPVWRIRVTVH